ncbi:molting protein mlt-4 [Anaeramoeba ignava]|uniref:Molting protein mlt-4 n=1 Tax=Anaeramoeba ignava TaxID=1746090 RepID=A0A9Q0RG90_ANAIG|nr:molting protein mlt-4 [Anaeramoeba ignava]
MNLSDTLSFVEAERTVEAFGVSNIPLLIKEAKNGKNGNILHFLCYKAKIQKLSKELETGKHDINKQDKMGNTPLHTTCFGGIRECFETIIKFDPNFSIQNQKNETPLDLAFLSNFDFAKQFLLQKNAPHHMNISDLQKAIILGNLEEALKIINNSSLETLEFKDKLMNTAAHDAAGYGRFPCLKALINKGVKIDEKNSASRTPLYLSVLNKHFECFEILIQNGAKVSTQNIYGYSPLHLAAEDSGHSDSFLETLLSNKANVALRDTDQMTPLHCAKTPSKTRLLLKYGADPNATDICNFAPIHFAAKKGDLLSIKELISFGSKISFTNSFIYQPISICTLKGNYKSLKYLLSCLEQKELNNYIDIENEKTKNIIVFALKKNHPKCLKFLLSKFVKKISLKRKTFLFQQAIISEFYECAYIISKIETHEEPQLDSNPEEFYHLSWEFSQDFLWLFKNGLFFSDSKLVLPKNKKQNHLSKKSAEETISFPVFNALIQSRIGFEKLDLFLEICKQYNYHIIKNLLKFIYTGILFRSKLKTDEDQTLREISKKLDFPILSKVLDQKIFFDQTIYEDLGKLLRKDLPVQHDFSIKVNNDPNQVIECHKYILASRSELFRGMFLSLNDPSNSAPDLSERSFDAVYQVIQFLYTDNLQTNDPIILEELSDADLYYGLFGKSFKNQFEQKIQLNEK